MTQPYDVIVAGGGPAGIAAAVAASRGGCRTLLIERYGFAGGMATAGMVNPFAGNCYVEPSTGEAVDVIEGIFAEVLDGLRSRRAVRRCLFAPGESRYYDTFDDIELRGVYDRLLSESGVETLFHAMVTGADVSSSGRIDEIHVQTKGGRQRFKATQFIDSTGDADLAVLAGASFNVGRPEDGLSQPCTTNFRMAGIDTHQLLAHGLRSARTRLTEMFLAARSAGRLEFPFRDSVLFYEHPHPGSLHFNCTRIHQLSGLSSHELTVAEREGRRQVNVLADWLRAAVPEFRAAYVAAVGTQVGVRETRRISGRYVLTGDDIRRGARFRDGVMRSGYFIDIHSPTGASDGHTIPGRPFETRPEFLARRFYELPFRSLVTEPLQNLLVACRAVSTDFEAHAAVRVMANMHAVGEAAGHAVALARMARLDVGELDGADVRRRMPYLDRPLAGAVA